MFVTCHITFGQLSNFVRASLKVPRTIRNNKLHFTRRCSILLLKKEKGPETGFLFFFQWFRQFFKYLNCNHNTLSYLLFSKYFSWFLYLVVQRGTGVFRVFFFFSTPPLERDLRFTVASRLPPFDRKTLKKCLFCRSRPPL